MNYKNAIIKMLEHIQSEKYLKMAYGFIKTLYRETNKTYKNKS